MIRANNIVLTLLTLHFVTGCGFFAARPLEGKEVDPPTKFNLTNDKTPCYLELSGTSTGLRMNCFDIDGVLHIHSSRWAKLPRFSGESWTVSIRRTPYVRIEIGGKIHSMKATAIEDENARREILYNRDYWHAWDAITVFQFSPGESRDIGSQKQLGEIPAGV